MLSNFITNPAAMLALSALVTAAPASQVQLSIPAQLQLADT
jgi:hypothetical protein